MSLLEELRCELHFPIIINSGYRCPEHNKKIGGSLRSWHMKFATDVRPKWEKNVWSLGERAKFLQHKRMEELRGIAQTLGFRGVGEYEWFVHLDTRPTFTTWEG